MGKKTPRVYDLGDGKKQTPRVWDLGDGKKKTLGFGTLVMGKTNP
jgi:hypothetical protein